jgi:hypothetical protein
MAGPGALTAGDGFVSLRRHTLRLNRALGFYERHGFVVTAPRGDYIDLEWVVSDEGLP